MRIMFFFGLRHFASKEFRSSQSTERETEQVPATESYTKNNHVNHIFQLRHLPAQRLGSLNSKNAKITKHCPKRGVFNHLH